MNIILKMLVILIATKDVNYDYIVWASHMC